MGGFLTNTSDYRIFIQGGIIDSQSTMLVPVALSSDGAEYMRACDARAMLYHLRELLNV